MTTGETAEGVTTNPVTASEMYSLITANQVIAERQHSAYIEPSITPEDKFFKMVIRDGVEVKERIILTEAEQEFYYKWQHSKDSFGEPVEKGELACMSSCPFRPVQTTATPLAREMSCFKDLCSEMLSALREVGDNMQWRAKSIGRTVRRTAEDFGDKVTYPFQYPHMAAKEFEESFNEFRRCTADPYCAYGSPCLQGWPCANGGCPGWHDQFIEGRWGYAESRVVPRLTCHPENLLEISQETTPTEDLHGHVDEHDGHDLSKEVKKPGKLQLVNQSKKKSSTNFINKITNKINNNLKDKVVGDSHHDGVNNNNNNKSNNKNNGLASGVVTHFVCEQWQLLTGFFVILFMIYKCVKCKTRKDRDNERTPLVAGSSANRTRYSTYGSLEDSGKTPDDDKVNRMETGGNHATTES